MAPALRKAPGFLVLLNYEKVKNMSMKMKQILRVLLSKVMED